MAPSEIKSQLTSDTRIQHRIAAGDLRHAWGRKRSSFEIHPSFNAILMIREREVTLVSR